jgi:hypothetical protein
MNETDFRRLADQIASRTEQRLIDLIETYKQDKETSKEWRESIDKRLKPLEEMAKQFDAPLKAAGYVLVAILGGAGLAIYRWVERHWG